MYSISEVADRLGLSASTIRNWENSLDMLPTRTGTGQQRVYSQEDIDVFQKIAQLREDGLSLDVIKSS
ncbi:helix-turn-helix domain-containing protein [Paenibacillus hexagrammi]|uniref:helix-turn-helix domain-containing protein n=1 Tax=Paenibacillus hexagrammi TaxID=2908839 RepID=UPI00331304A4